MALARNLNLRRKRNKLPKFPKLNKWTIGVIVAVSFVVIFFGTTMIFPNIFASKKEKAEVKYETGDRPLPQKVSIYVTADGGLYMREQPDSKSKAVSLIPNGTQLTAEETLGEWYKVIYQSKTGWVNRSYVTTQAPAEDPTKNWQTYQNKPVGYSLRYPADWVAQDYGANIATASDSYVGFGAQLSPALDPARLPPVVVRVTKKALTEVEGDFSKQSNVITEAATVSGIPGKKYTYNTNSGVQMTSFVIGKGSSTFVIEETGGFSDELAKLIATVIFS